MPMRQIITLRVSLTAMKAFGSILFQVPEAKAGIYKSNFAAITNRILTSDFYILP